MSRTLATLDPRTSEVCRDLDGQEFEAAQARPNVNLPPMHPNCRSTTVSVIDGEALAAMRRAAQDPETGEHITVRANMSYREWEESLQPVIKAIGVTSQGVTVRPVIPTIKVQPYEASAKRGLYEEWEGIDEHDLVDGRQRFDSDPDQAWAWQRLVDGRNIWESDIVLLNHELLELTLMLEYGYNYDKAHEEANKKYNWDEILQADKKRHGK